MLIENSLRCVFMLKRLIFVFFVVCVAFSPHFMDCRLKAPQHQRTIVDQIICKSVKGNCEGILRSPLQGSGISI